MKNLIMIIAVAAITSLMATSCLPFTSTLEPAPTPAPSPAPSPSPVPVNIPPVAYIDSIIPSQAVEDQLVSFQGHGTDKDGTVVAYRWSSSLDGDLGTTATFETSSLSVGDHSIGLIVQDNNGDWSEMSTTTFKVVEEAPPEEIPPIEDIPWELQAYGDAGDLKALLAGTTVTAEFKSDTGKVAGSGGCNSYSVNYEIDGNQLTIIPPITSTMMLCFPAARMTQEHDFFELLNTAETFLVHADKLIISCADDKEMVFVEQVEEAPPEEMPPIEDITWELQEYGDAEALSSLLAGTTVTAEFKSDVGKVAGSGGCNSYSVNYEIDGNQLTIIPPVTSTMMLCFPAARMTQEHDFFALLSAAETYNIQDDELSIYCSGDGLLIFTPQ